MAPLDIKFTSDGSLAYVTFHGSWDRDEPVGYKLSTISFSKGEPTEPADSKSATQDILSNPDTSQCPGKCFRPVGLAIDGQGRIFMTSDSTGEIYVIRQTTGGAAASSTSTPPSTTTSATGAVATSTGSTSPNAAVAGYNVPRRQEWLLIGLTLALSAVCGVFFAVG